MQFKMYFENTNTDVVYHQTTPQNAEKIRRYGFNLAKTTMGIIWFTNDLESLKSRAIHSEGAGAILKMSVRIEKAAGWDEYHNLMLAQLKQEGYDGVILPESDGTFCGFVFDPKKIQILDVI